VVAVEPPVDGRTARSQRTRDAVVDALQALIEEGDPSPSARRIAERAGVSTRSIFAHFSSLEDLHRAMAERAAALVITMLTRIDPDQPLAARIESLCAQRGRVNEEVGALRRAAARREASSPTLARARDHAREASRDQIARVFAAELAPLDEQARRHRIAAVDALVSGDTWDLLRSAAHSLTPAQARRALVDALHLLLVAPGSPSPATPAVPAVPAAAAVPDGDREADLEAARRVLAATEEKIERLVAAIEAGSPPELLSPRLRDLEATRAALRRELDPPQPPATDP
jgi:TetR/AcrR family transcriptional regulator, regulator of autoinduction and epiphytic fitness